MQNCDDDTTLKHKQGNRFREGDVAFNLTLKVITLLNSLSNLLLQLAICFH